MQVVIKLEAAECGAFSRWLARTAIAASAPDLGAGEAIRAIIRVAMRSDDIGGQVASQLRHERAADRRTRASPQEDTKHAATRR
jgi:hypothetical protein